MTRLNRREIKEHAFEQTKKFFWSCCIIGLISLIISFIGLFSIGFGLIFSFIVGAVIAVGRATFDLKVTRNQNGSVKDLIQNGDLVIKSILLKLLMFIKIFLWSLLLIIPGILKAFSYAMSYQVLVDNPDMKVSDILKRSEELMYGRRWELFVLELSFIGWFLLSGITYGLTLLFVLPYLRIAKSQFYVKLLEEDTQSETTKNLDVYQVELIDNSNYASNEDDTTINDKEDVSRDDKEDVSETDSFEKIL